MKFASSSLEIRGADAEGRDLDQYFSIADMVILDILQYDTRVWRM